MGRYYACIRVMLTFLWNLRGGRVRLETQDVVQYYYELTIITAHRVKSLLLRASLLLKTSVRMTYRYTNWA